MTVPVRRTVHHPPAGVGPARHLRLPAHLRAAGEVGPGSSAVDVRQTAALCSPAAVRAATICT